jgi:trk system potassium uptake protein TrkA
MDIGTVIYPKNITAERIVQYVRGMSNSLDSNIEALYRINGGKVEVLEFLVTANAPVINKPLKDLKLKKGILIACINHKGDIITPSGTSIISPGDTVIVVTTNTGFRDIKDILE